ncbi:hypothetical protein QCA50_015212 [Cerrena zonata]|uniref:NAD(P)-binding protein n=1 Tax=Cerrena zonata TaxID=2478898 RepID=A0AAW0FUB8_9APHY
MSTLILSANDVDRVVSKLSPDDLVNLMALVFSQLSSPTSSTSNNITQPQRIAIPMQNHTGLFMPSRISSIGTAIKVVSVPSASAPLEVREKGLPGSTFVFDEESGRVNGVVNASKLTAVRNAAGSLLATRLLLPTSKPPTKLITFGAGAQISAHITLFLTHYPTITHVIIYNRSLNPRLTSLLTSLQTQFPNPIKFEAKELPDPSLPEDQRGGLKESLRDASIVVTATSSTVPLFPSSFVTPGTHLCLIGSYKPTMHEIDSELVLRAGKVVVDSKEACEEEAGELLTAKLPISNWIELGTLYDFNKDTQPVQWSSRTELIEDVQSAGDVTIFKSVGVGVQDVAIAHAVMKRAKELGVGVYVDL